jgi:hypothetical protein
VPVRSAPQRVPVRVVATSARRALQLETRGIEFTQQRQRIDGRRKRASAPFGATLVPTKMQWASRPESSARCTADLASPSTTRKRASSMVATNP